MISQADPDCFQRKLDGKVGAFITARRGAPVEVLADQFLDQQYPELATSGDLRSIALERVIDSIDRLTADQTDNQLVMSRAELDSFQKTVDAAISVEIHAAMEAGGIVSFEDLADRVLEYVYVLLPARASSGELRQVIREHVIESANRAGYPEEYEGELIHRSIGRILLDKDLSEEERYEQLDAKHDELMELSRRETQIAERWHAYMIRKFGDAESDSPEPV